VIAALVPLLVLLAQQTPPCVPPACASEDVLEIYMQGWAAARDAARVGGSPVSLAPVDLAIARLDRLAAGAHGPAEIAAYVLRAAADAARDEREAMALFLVHALDLERVQLEARQPGAPGITAHEAAGELWLRVRRYADAKRAYEHARSVVGSTPLIEAGLSRAEEALRR
jgi:hypothetical protein